MMPWSERHFLNTCVLNKGDRKGPAIVVIVRAGVDDADGWGSLRSP